jgi:glycerol-3-phosphate dehydrogenase
VIDREERIRDPQHLELLRRERVNRRQLPDIALPPNLAVEPNLDTSLKGAAIM